MCSSCVEIQEVPNCPVSDLRSQSNSRPLPQSKRERIQGPLYPEELSHHSERSHHSEGSHLEVDGSHCLKGREETQNQDQTQVA